MGTMNDNLKMSKPAQKAGRTKKKLPEWTKQESGSVANVFSSLDKKSIDIDKKGRENKQTQSKTNVFSNFTPVNKDKKYKISQNAKDFVNPSQLIVNKKYQKRVNTILGD